VILKIKVPPKPVDLTPIPIPSAPASDPTQTE
jgi:hypothetical protein